MLQKKKKNQTDALLVTIMTIYFNSVPMRPYFLNSMLTSYVRDYIRGFLV